MNQSHFLAVGKLMANHRADIKPRIPVAVILLLLLLLLLLLYLLTHHHYYYLYC